MIELQIVIYRSVVRYITNKTIKTLYPQGANSKRNVFSANLTPWNVCFCSSMRENIYTSERANCLIRMPVSGLCTLEVKYFGILMQETARVSNFLRKKMADAVQQNKE